MPSIWTSCRQSPTVMSAVVPPFAASMAAIRRIADSVESACAASFALISASRANPAGSRLRAISVGIALKNCGNTSHDRLGRITSAPSSNLVPRPNRAYSWAVVLPAPRRNCSEASLRNSTFPAASAPLACHRCCQVSPGSCRSHRRVATSPSFRSESVTTVSAAERTVKISLRISASLDREAAHSVAVGRGGNCLSSVGRSG